MTRCGLRSGFGCARGRAPRLKQEMLSIVGPYGGMQCNFHDAVPTSVCKNMMCFGSSKFVAV